MAGSAASGRKSNGAVPQPRHLPRGPVPKDEGCISFVGTFATRFPEVACALRHCRMMTSSQWSIKQVREVPDPLPPKPSVVLESTLDLVRFLVTHRKVRNVAHRGLKVRDTKGTVIV